MVRVFNRSDRVWVFGYVRMAPLVLFVGGAVTLFLLRNWLLTLPVGTGTAALLLVFVGPFVLDRLPQLNPVNYLVLSDRLQVTRIAGRARVHEPGRVKAVEFTPREGEDYDDRQRRRPMTEVTVRLRRAWPARLLATREDAVALAVWAHGNGVPVREPHPPDDPTCHEPG
jgi:hypothetical protein